MTSLQSTTIKTNQHTYVLLNMMPAQVYNTYVVEDNTTDPEKYIQHVLLYNASLQVVFRSKWPPFQKLQQYLSGQQGEQPMHEIHTRIIMT